MVLISLVQAIITTIRASVSGITWKDILVGIGDFLGELDISTVTVLIGAFALKHAGTILTGSTLKTALETKLKSLASAAGLSTAVTGVGVAAFTIEVAIIAKTFSSDFKEWVDSIKNYGWDEGRKKAAKENAANPYQNGNAITDKTIEDYKKRAKGRAAKNQANPYNSNSEKSKRTLEFEAKIKTKASDLWRKLKENWDKIKDKFADFKARVKNDSKEWWKNVKDYWKEKVGNVKAFTTNVKNNASEWWKNTKGWWGEKVGKVENFTTGVKNRAGEWWSNVRDWWKNAIENKEVKKFTANVKKAGGTWWKDVRDAWSEYTSDKKLSVAIEFAKNALSNMWSSVTKFFSGKSVNVRTTATKKANGGVFANGRWNDVKRYSVGGLPNMGQLFVAREAGPELVGNLGGHTAVVNNDQIVASVADGVARAVASVLGSGRNANQPIQVYLDGRLVFESTRNYANDFFRRTGNPPYPV